LNLLKMKQIWNKCVVYLSIAYVMWDVNRKIKKYDKYPAKTEFDPSTMDG